MSKRKAFWGESQRTRRQVSGIVSDLCVDFEVSMFGVRFIKRGNGEETRWILWKELFEVARRGVPTDAASCPRCGGTRRIWAIPDNAPCPSCTEPIHGPLNESAGLRILPAEEKL